MAPVKLILISIFLVLGWGMALKGRIPLPKATWLALGDSYTIGEAVDPRERYPVQVRRLLAQYDSRPCGNPEIVAATGWTTANLLSVLRSNDLYRVYDVVSLLIGVNNQFQGRSQAEYA